MARSRCPATDTVVVTELSLELRCVHWGEDGRHPGEHIVHTPAVMDDYTWPNDDPSET